MYIVQKQVSYVRKTIVSEYEPRSQYGRQFSRALMIKGTRVSRSLLSIMHCKFSGAQQSGTRNIQRDMPRRLAGFPSGVQFSGTRWQRGISLSAYPKIKARAATITQSQQEDCALLLFFSRISLLNLNLTSKLDIGSRGGGADILPNLTRRDSASPRTGKGLERTEKSPPQSTCDRRFTTQTAGFASPAFP